MCTLRPLLRVFSHSPASVSLLCLSHFFVGVRHLSRSFFNFLLYCSQVFFISFAFFIHHCLPESSSCIFILWPQSRPFLLSPPRREVIRSLTFLYNRVNRIMVPRIPRLNIIVYTSFIRCPSWPKDVIQLRRPSLRFIPRCKKAISLSRPSQDHVEVTLQLNSFIISYHISLESLGRFPILANIRSIYLIKLIVIILVCAH